MLLSWFQTYAVSTQKCKYNSMSSISLRLSHLNQQVESWTYDGEYSKEIDISIHSYKQLYL